MRERLAVGKLGWSAQDKTCPVDHHNERSRCGLGGTLPKKKDLNTSTSRRRALRAVHSLLASFAKTTRASRKPSASAARSPTLPLKPRSSCRPLRHSIQTTIWLRFNDSHSPHLSREPIVAVSPINPRPIEFQALPKSTNALRPPRSFRAPAIDNPTDRPTLLFSTTQSSRFDKVSQRCKRPWPTPF